MKQLRRVSFGKDANGCPVVGTAFVLVDGTSCGELRALHSAGWEVAVHAVNHKSVRAQSTGLGAGFGQRGALGGRPA